MRARLRALYGWILAVRLHITGRLLLAVLLALGAPSASRGADPEPETGTASWYGPGSGVAVQWCTWTLRHTAGCGYLAVQSHQTGVTVVAPIVDWCQCYRGTPDERIVDLQWGVLAALGLERADGLYPVTTWRVDASPAAPQGAHASGGAAEPALPDTAVAR